MSQLFVILFMLCAPIAVSAQILTNQMKQAHSPYLQQHAQDKVHWQNWNAASLALAKQQQKPILLSIGYFACHWCHVMQQESYQNQAVADLLNQFYIPIKIDRELQPGLDQSMLSYAKSHIGVAGWPLNVYLTPDTRPYDAHVYLDAPSFVSRLTQNQQMHLSTAAHLASIIPLSQNLFSNTPNERLFLESALSEIDPTNGGFIGTRKFPQAPKLHAITHYLRKSTNNQLNEWFSLTLSQLINYGLYDPVKGGFYRYTVDSEWQIPHFEKMLIDNAQLWHLSTQLGQQEGASSWKLIAEQTLSFMLTHLYDSNKGAFFSSLSALDYQGQEGGHYLWTLAQLRQHLSPAQLALVNPDWQLDYPPSFDLGYLPKWGNHARPDQRRQAIFEKLEAARASTPIATDRKLLISYNGMMLSFIAQQLNNQPQLKPIAKRLVSFIQQAWQEGQLSQGSYGGKMLAEADLEGYAFAAKGLIDFAIVSGDVDASELAFALLHRSNQLFIANDGFIAQAAVGEFSLPRQTAFADTALIAPTSVWIEASLQSRQPLLVNQAEQQLKKANTLMQQSPLEYASLWVVYWKWQTFLTPN